MFCFFPRFNPQYLIKTQEQGIIRDRFKYPKFGTFLAKFSTGSFD